MPTSIRPDAALHQFHRHPALPWAELRISRQSCYSYRLHAHAQYSIGIIDEGETLFHHDQGPEHVRTGGVVLIEPEHWHACNPELAQPWSYRMLFVQASWLHVQLGVDTLHFERRAIHDHALTQRVNLACTPLAAHADAHAIEAHTQAVVQLFRELGTAIHSTPLPPCAGTDYAAPQATLRSRNAAFPALEQMHRHPEEDATMQSLAERCGMSPTRFIRHFKTLTGVTPNSYRLNLRLNGARQLLAQGASLADAALHMGFADQAHMQRAFKAHHAMTPGNYAHRQG